MVRPDELFLVRRRGTALQDWTKVAQSAQTWPEASGLVCGCNKPRATRVTKDTHSLHAATHGTTDNHRPPSQAAPSDTHLCWNPFWLTWITDCFGHTNALGILTYSRILLTGEGASSLCCACLNAWCVQCDSQMHRSACSCPTLRACLSNKHLFSNPLRSAVLCGCPVNLQVSHA